MFSATLISCLLESLVPDGVHSQTGTLGQDLDKLGDLLDDNVPAYILVRLDDPPTEWLAVYYVPDSAKVRDKVCTRILRYCSAIKVVKSVQMLYAATRNTLTKSLGSAHFTDNLFASAKDDLNAEAYAKHRRHLAAPKPMSAREKEMEAVKAAEREAGGRSYEGNRARQNHIGQGVFLKWSSEAEEAIKELATSEDSRLVILVSGQGSSAHSRPLRRGLLVDRRCDRNASGILDFRSRCFPARQFSATI